jgi:YidC/Oxa1 family membrane protein insertase
VEKRLVLFVVLSIGVMIGSIAINAWISSWNRKPPDQNVAAADAGEDADGEDAGENGENEADGGAAAAEGEDAGGEKQPPGDEGKKDDEGKNADGGEKEQPAEPPKVEPAAPGQPLGVAEQQRATLGSLDAESKFSALYTVNNRGAAIERVELNDPSYLDLEDDSGYFGHLALEDATETGCLVNVVGPGTPAAEAGIQPGDVIVAFNGEPVGDLITLDRLVSKTRPGQKVAILLVRGEGDNAKQLDVQVTLRRRPLELIRPEPASARARSIEIDPPHDPLSLLMTIGSSTKSKRRGGFLELDGLRTANWKMKKLKGQNAVEFSLGPEEGLTAERLAEVGLRGKLEIVKRVRLVPGKMGEFKAYHAVVDIELRNLGDEPITRLGYVLDGPNGLPTEGWWYSYKVQPNWGSAGARDVIYKTDAMQSYDFVTCYTIWNQAETEDEPYVQFVSNDPPEARKLHYAGVDAQYFAAVLLPGTLEQKQRGQSFSQFELLPVNMDRLPDKKRYKLTNVTFRMRSDSFDLAAGASHKQSFVLFAGPKDPDLLSEYRLDSFVYYGWFHYVSAPLVEVLHFFHWVTFDFSYGLAIIMLTLLVRACMFPISRKAVRNAQMMQALQPEMKAIAEKYKNDMEKRGKAQKELFNKYNYNPFGGCLLMFFQLPIFLGLYRALCVDIALRGAPLIRGLPWCSNLAAPDMLFYWEPLWPYFTAPTGWLGPYFNILPLFTVVLFVVQQKMFTPPPTDETQQMQQKMMMGMTLLIGLMFFKVPSGLCLYFITSSLWGVFERKVLPKPKLPGDLEKKTEAMKNKKPVSEEKSSGNGAAKAARRNKAKGRR